MAFIGPAANRHEVQAIEGTTCIPDIPLDRQCCSRNIQSSIDGSADNIMEPSYLVRTGEMRTFAWFCLALLLAACSASVTSIRPEIPPSHAYEAHTRMVRLIPGPLPPDTKYEVLETISAKFSNYVGTSTLDKPMADRARAIGADAVILVNKWYAPSGGVFAAPHAQGQAVKLLNPESVNLDALPGAWF